MFLDPFPHLDLRAASEGWTPLFVAERGSRCFGTDDASSDRDMLAVVMHPPARYVSLEGVPMSHGTAGDGDVSSAVIDVRRALQLCAWGGLGVYQASRSADVLVDRDGVGAFMREVSSETVEATDMAFQHRDQMKAALKAMRNRGAAPAKAWVHLLQQAMSIRHALETSEPAPVSYVALVAACTDARLADLSAEAVMRKQTGADAFEGARRDLALALASEAAGLLPEDRRERRPANPGIVARVDAFLARLLVARPDAAPGDEPVDAETPQP